MIFNFEKIKKNKLTYVIAEIGVNHECSLRKAKRMIYLAKKGGASAAKFQTYKSETIASRNSPAYWDLKKKELSRNICSLKNLMDLSKMITFI